MTDQTAHHHIPAESKLLLTLQRLLEIQGTEVKAALDEASQLLAQALNADKVDIFLYEESSATLVAVGTSQTPMGILQHKIGMDRLPVANGGRTVEVFESGQAYHTDHADQDPQVLRGMKEGLGIRSMIVVSLDVDTQRRGVLSACTAQPESFSAADSHFLESVSRWIGVIIHRAELVEQMRRDAAERAQQTVANELITVLAHDLRNYLAPLRGRLDLLLGRARRDNRTIDIRDAQLALTSFERLHQLIKNMLDSARLEQGLFTFEPRSFNLNELAEKTVAMLRTPDHTLQISSLEELCIDGDPNNIQQVLENLISNALKHAPRGSTVSIRLERETRDTGQWSLVKIHDQGPGIPAEIRERIFQRFAAGPNSSGLGLGLYIAQGIVSAHGGALTVDSDPATGTTFTVALPISPSLLDSAPSDA
ncbi:MAG: HAMP domain-containing histidine kinase [Herpetosiphonaceae bacterium]|nr:HAMP domain-containing histidine kinase [Herpetosiphonaceae bacterium]